MAKIVLGLAVSHSPMLSIPVEHWHKLAERDKQYPDVDFEQLAQNAPAWLNGHLTPEIWQQNYARFQNGIAELSRILDEASPDILVVIGDDQNEMFIKDFMPAFYVFTGDEIMDLPMDREKMHPALRPSYWSRHGEEPEAYPTEGQLGRHIVESMVLDEFDVAHSAEQPGGRSIGHAHTFVRRRLRQNKKMIPMIPILINTFFPPNVPSSKRCYDFGRSLRRAIESWDSDKTVAVIATGGLTHFVVDEELDRKILNMIKSKDREGLSSIPKERLISGTSEILNWVTAAGALDDMNPEILDYIPAYRSMARSGCGMGFVYWK